MSDETKLFLGIIIATVAIVGGAIFFLSGSGSSNVPKADPKLLIRSDSPTVASPSASVTLVEFGDYQCPACGAYYPVVQQMLNDFAGKMTFVFREFPLPMHQNGQISAEAAVAAGLQGKYWEMHEALYSKQSDWGESTDARTRILGYAKDIGLNVDQFTKDLDSSKVKDFINRDVNDGDALGINATPTFYVNGQKIDNPPSVADFENIIKAAIADAPKPTASATEKYHTHFNFLVMLNGKPFDFTPAKYQSNNGKDLSEDIHLHDGKGDLVHIHKKGATLGEFFTSLKMKLSQNSFTDDAGNTYTVSMYVNGKQNAQFDAYEPQDMDKILITTDTGAVLVQQQEAKVADDACIYSLKCPERGKPPTESCVGGLGSDCSN